MEEQLSIIDKYLKLYDDKNYRDTFYNFTYSEMIQHFIDYKIYDYDEKYGALPNKDKIIDKYKQKIISINDTEIKEKVFPLILFIGKEFYQELYKVGFFNNLKEFLLKKFKEVNFDINLSTLDRDSYQYENQSNLKKELEEFNFNTILEFSFSQQTMGNNQYARFMYFIADKMFFEEYCKILNNKDNFNFLYLTNSLEWDYHSTNTRDKKRRVKLLKYLTKNNRVILELRLLRDLLCYEYDEVIVKGIILNLSKNKIIWEQFSNYFVSNPSRYKKLFSPLGKLLSKLATEYIDILIDSIKIDKISNNESTKVLTDCFLEIGNDDIQKYCLESIYIKWKNYIEGYSEYFGSIILTDVINLVIIYVKNFLEKDVIIKDVEKIIYKLNEIDNKWFKDSSEQNNYFYKQMSKLFIYSFSLDKYSLSDLKEKISSICTNNRILKKEQVYQAKTTLQLFKEHII